MKKTCMRITAVILQLALLVVLLPISPAKAESPVEYSKPEVPAYFKPLTEEEIETFYSYDENDPNTIVVTQLPARSRTTLPKVVDNSKSKYFPEIENQGVNGICETFSQIYYGYTYMTARLRDIDVKTLGKSVSFAPYQRASSYWEKHGAVLWNEAPLGPYDSKYPLPLSNYSMLPEIVPYTDAADWRYMLRNKPLGKLMVDGRDLPTGEYIELLKAHLSQGYVLTTGINTDWISVKAKNNPNSSLDDEFYAAAPKYSNHTIIGAYSPRIDHAITLVGYNDDIWVDVNINGIVEQEELGAFRVANSWGKTWEDYGYVWLSYDAFFEKTQMPNHFAPNRNANRSFIASVLLPRKELYTPELLAEFNLKALRNDENMLLQNMYIGCRPFGSTDDVRYSRHYLVGILDRAGYEGTRVFDLTDYITENNLDLANKKYEWFLKIEYETKDKSPDVVELKDFKLTDGNGNVLAASSQELSFDGKSMSDGKNTYTNSTHFYSNYIFSGTMKLKYGATARANGPWDVVWQSVNDITSISIANNEVIETAPVPEREGYTFMGWYIDDRFTEKAVFPYTAVDDVVFYAKWVRDSSGNLVYDINDIGVAIDLDTETLILPDGYMIAAYSTDGGGKWKKGMPNIPSLLNKPLRLAISDTYDIKTKKVDTESIISFPPIEARPKTNPDKLIINYAICADPTGATPGAWTLSQKGSSDAFVGNIEIALSLNKKTPDRSGGDYPWLAIDGAGVPVQPLGSPKQTYLARTPPVADGGRYVPASKPFKLTPQAQQKPTKIKADYKNEVIKLKAGQHIYGGGLETLQNTFGNTQTASSANGFAIGLLYKAQKSDKAGVSISTILDASVSENPTAPVVCIWTAATVKKPASKVQEYKLAARANITSQTINATNGKAALPKTLEVYDSARKKWGLLPKFSSSVTLENAVRVKATARATGADDSSQLAASEAVDLTVYYDNSGVFSVVIGETDVTQEITKQATFEPPMTEEPQEAQEMQSEVQEISNNEELKDVA